MKARVTEFLACFFKIFCLLNFVVGTLMYAFTSDRITPVPEMSTMLFICLGAMVFTVVSGSYGRR